jgi:hypothetical protein
MKLSHITTPSGLPQHSECAPQPDRGERCETAGARAQTLIYLSADLLRNSPAKTNPSALRQRAREKPIGMAFGDWKIVQTRGQFRFCDHQMVGLAEKGSS